MHFWAPFQSQNHRIWRINRFSLAMLILFFFLRFSDNCLITVLFTRWPINTHLICPEILFCLRGICSKINTGKEHCVECWQSCCVWKYFDLNLLPSLPRGKSPDCSSSATTAANAWCDCWCGSLFAEGLSLDPWSSNRNSAPTRSNLTASVFWTLFFLGFLMMRADLNASRHTYWIKVLIIIGNTRDFILYLNRLQITPAFGWSSISALFYFKSWLCSSLKGLCFIRSFEIGSPFDMVSKAIVSLV